MCYVIEYSPDEIPVLISHFKQSTKNMKGTASPDADEH